MCRKLAALMRQMSSSSECGSQADLRGSGERNHPAVLRYAGTLANSNDGARIVDLLAAQRRVRLPGGAATCMHLDTTLPTSATP